MELTYSKEQIPQFTSPKKAEETKLTFTENDSTKSNKIQLLPEHLIDQIKAGEVIERPSALVKELIENSIDSGATSIEVRIAKAGLDLISVSDNGSGIDFDDLPLAFARHATSKIDRYEDLFSLNSYGFRGEALASASSIARITCWSSPAAAISLGGKIEIHGAKIISHTPHPIKKSGTTIQVRDLFFNTPVRLQFIRSLQSEKNSIEKIIQAFIIANPGIAFHIGWEEDGSIVEKESYPAVASFNERAKMLLTGPKEQLIYSTYQYQAHSIQALIKLKGTKSTHKLQLFCANRRLFYDKSLHQILIKTMSTIWPIGTTGEYIINITVPPSKIDVNVHPNKTQLKFVEHAVVSALVRYVAQDICQQAKCSTPESLNSKTTTPANQEFTDSKNPLFKVDSCVGHILPAGWSLYQHANKGPLLIDEIWLILSWWKLVYKCKSEQVPLLVALPIELSITNQKEIETWKLLFTDLFLDVHFSDHNQIIIRAIPQCTRDLNIYSMLIPLLNFSVQQIINFMETGELPCDIPTSTKNLPKNHLEILVQACFKENQTSGPIRSWSTLESWWRSQ